MVMIEVLDDRLLVSWNLFLLHLIRWAVSITSLVEFQSCIKFVLATRLYMKETHSMTAIERICDSFTNKYKFHVFIQIKIKYCPCYCFITNIYLLLLVAVQTILNTTAIKIRQLDVKLTLLNVLFLSTKLMCHILCEVSKQITCAQKIWPVVNASNFK